MRDTLRPATRRSSPVPPQTRASPAFRAGSRGCGVRVRRRAVSCAARACARPAEPFGVRCGGARRLPLLLRALCPASFARCSQALSISRSRCHTVSGCAGLRCVLLGCIHAARFALCCNASFASLSLLMPCLSGFNASQCSTLGARWQCSRVSGVIAGMASLARNILTMLARMYPF